MTTDHFSVRPVLVLAVAAASAVAMAAAQPEPIGSPRQEAPAQDGAARADALAAALEADSGAQTEEERQRLFVEGFESFIERMDDFDGPRSVRLARAMHRRADAIWSVFCLEGALRRSSDADPRSELSGRAYSEADTALSAMLARGGLTRADELALVQRRAILAAGFDDRAGERASLGRALALGGIDGAQISGVAALTRGDAEAAARLFGSLLDGTHATEDLPWPVRGHGIASLEALRARDL